jgi:hypothetical protein
MKYYKRGVVQRFLDFDKRAKGNDVKVWWSVVKVEGITRAFGWRSFT